VKAKLVGDFGGIHGILEQSQSSTLSREAHLVTYGQILFVGEDEEQSISQLVLVQHALQLLTSFYDTVAIVAVDNENDALGVLEVMSPQRSDLVLTTDIPDGELDVLILNGLNVEA
jgi:hypothetical protein